MIKKIYFTKSLELLYFCFLIIISFLAVINLFSRNPASKSLHILSVVSGSMSPGIPVGSAVFIQKASDYYINDIISFRYQNKIITHRLVYAGKYYLTKGDANNVIDRFQIDKSQIIGKVMFSLPYVGYLQESSKSLFGLIAFIYVPALIIIVVESRQIVKQFNNFETKRLNLRSLTVVLIGLFIAIDQTYAFYSTKQFAFNGTITTALLSPSPSSTVLPTSVASATPSPLPSRTSSPSPTTSGNNGNGSGSTNTVIINNSSSTEVNQSNTSTQINNITNNVNTGNNNGEVINTATSSATTSINNQSGNNSVIIH